MVHETKKRLLNLADDLLYEAYLRVWRTRDGRLIPLRNLDDRHLSNIISMLERKGVAKLDFYLNNPGPNGEMAQMAYQEEVDRELENFPIKVALLIPRLATLKLELERRRTVTESAPARVAEKIKDTAAVAALNIYYKEKHALECLRGR